MHNKKQMENYRIILEKFTELLGIPMVVWQKGTCIWPQKHLLGNPLMQKTDLIKMLLQKAANQEAPVIYRDEQHVLFAVVKRDEIYFLFGPVSMGRKNKVELHQYYKYYGLKVKEEEPLKVLDFAQVFMFVEAITLIVSAQRYTDEELIEINHLNTASYESLYIENFEEENFHHTYREEKELLKCIEEGNTGEALRLAVKMDAKLGRLSDNELLHWKKATVAAITLCTRTAIESGVSPVDGYQLSDYYIKKSDACKDISSVIVCRNQAIAELAEYVLAKKQKAKKTPHVEYCLTYIKKNYRRKIRIEDIAEEIGINSSYLSRLFSKEMEIPFQEYVVKVRLEKAAYLLKSSDMSITKIAEQLGFTSHSYFGKMFHRYYEMTPTAYRNENKF